MCFVWCLTLYRKSVPFSIPEELSFTQDILHYPAQLEPANTDSHPIFALLDPTACQGQAAPHDTVSETSISSKVNVCIRLNGAEILIADPVSGDLLNKVIKAVRSC